LLEVERHILELDERFGLEAVVCDPWQAESMMQRLEVDSGHRRRNQRRRFNSQPWVRSIPPTAANLREQATLVIESFGDRRLQLFDCEPLRRDLLKLRCEEKSYGIRLTSPRDGEGHGDTFSAFSLALLVGHELAGKKPFVVRSLLDPFVFDTTQPMPTVMQRASARLAAEADEYQREMDELHRGGADYAGNEEWRRIMEVLGRR
jgi:hypothetical protein